MQRKRLLIFHPALAPYRLDLFNALADNYECYIVFLSRNVRDQNFDQNILLSNARFKYDFLDKKIVVGPRDINCGYIHKINKFDPDIVVGMEYGLPLIIPYLYKKICNKKYSLYTICDDSLNIAQRCRGIRRALRNYLVPRISNIITISDEVANWYADRFKKEESPIVFPIIREDAKYFFDLSESIPITNNYIERYSLNGSKVFLYVGRLAKVKNLSYLLTVFNEFSQGRNVRLLLVGSGDEFVNLSAQHAQLQEKGKIIFIDRCEGLSLLAWYNVAQTFVLPSIYEPFGAVVGEALSAGCYCICSEYAGSSTLITPSNGYVFNPDTHNDLLDKLSKIEKQMDVCSPICQIKKSHITISFRTYFETLLLKLV